MGGGAQVVAKVGDAKVHMVKLRANGVELGEEHFGAMGRCEQPEWPCRAPRVARSAAAPRRRCACSLTPIAVAIGTALTHKAVAIELVTEICYRTEWELGLSSLNTAD